MAPAFTIILRYGGYFKDDQEFMYKEGIESNLEVTDVDYLSYFSLIDMIKGVNSVLEGAVKLDVFYCVPGMSLSEGLKIIRLDNDVMEMAVHGLKIGMIKVFVISEVENLFANRVNSPRRRQKLEVRRTIEDGAEYDERDSVGEEYGDSDSEGDEVNYENSTDGDSILSGGVSSDDDEEWYHSREKVRETQGVHHEKIQSIHGKKNQHAHHEKIYAVEEKRSHIVVHEKENSDHSNADSDDEYLHSPPRNDDEEECGSIERVSYKVESDASLKKLVWKVGMKFSAPEIFKEQVNRYGAFAGYCIRWWKNQRNQKLGAKCKEGCEWRIYASWDGPRESFVVKSVNPIHTCNRQDFENTQVSPRFLAKEYLTQYKKNPTWSRKALQDDVLLRFGKRIGRHSCYKVKKYAYDLIYGSIGHHYKKLGSYMAELKRVDSSTNIVLLTNKARIPRAPDVFKRIYVSFTAVRDGFLKGCRPIICLDGCFLKTYLGGMLLCAIGRDGNNQMYPISWAVVEAENNDSWSWFLNILKNDLPEFGGGSCTISSDQQKGLCNAVKEHFPNVEHRNCARHIYANWHKKHKGDELKMHFWRAARAYTKADFEIAIKDMGMVSKKAVEDFIGKGPLHFCRSYLKTGSRCEVIVNNLAETFNGYILDARSKPLIYMLEEIRLKVMERMFNNRQLMCKQQSGDICPRIRARLNQNKEEARQCVSLRASEAEFQVMHHTDMFSVHILEKTCSCRKWDLTGIPCCHAISSLNSIRVEPETLVYDWFKKDKYDKAYNGSIRTICGEKHWTKINYSLDPPEVKVGAGRPKKNRRKDPHERYDKKNKLSKHGIQMTCSKCNGNSHNRRTCPQKEKISISEKQPQQPKPRGRPRKDGTPSTKKVEDPMQPKRKRGRPTKVVETKPPYGVPNGRGIYFGLNQRVYVNPGQPGGTVISQSSGALGSSQLSQS